MKTRLRVRLGLLQKGGVGVTASMIVLGPEEGDTYVSCSAVQASEDCYAMVDSDTNAIIVPLHPDLCGEVAECKVPSSVVQGPIAQVFSFNGERRRIVSHRSG